MFKIFRPCCIPNFLSINCSRYQMTRKIKKIKSALSQWMYQVFGNKTCPYARLGCSLIKSENVIKLDVSKGLELSCAGEGEKNLSQKDVEWVIGIIRRETFQLSTWRQGSSIDTSFLPSAVKRKKKNDAVKSFSSLNGPESCIQSHDNSKKRESIVDKKNYQQCDVMIWQHRLHPETHPLSIYDTC